MKRPRPSPHNVSSRALTTLSYTAAATEAYARPARSAAPAAAPAEQVAAEPAFELFDRARQRGLAEIALFGAAGEIEVLLDREEILT